MKLKKNNEGMLLKYFLAEKEKEQTLKRRWTKGCNFNTVQSLTYVWSTRIRLKKANNYQKSYQTTQNRRNTNPFSFDLRTIRPLHVETPISLSSLLLFYPSLSLSLSLSLSKGSFSLIHIYQVENCDDKDQVLLVLVSFFFMKNKKRIIRRKNNNALLGQRGWLKMTSLTTNKAHSKVQ
jgi:hypothetical protein